MCNCTTTPSGSQEECFKRQRPRALPWAILSRPFGAFDSVTLLSCGELSAQAEESVFCDCTQPLAWRCGLSLNLAALHFSFGGLGDGLEFFEDVAAEHHGFGAGLFQLGEHVL
jgi:hypothetical protein